MFGCYVHAGDRCNRRKPAPQRTACPPERRCPGVKRHARAWVLSAMRWQIKAAKTDILLLMSSDNSFLSYRRG